MFGSSEEADGPYYSASQHLSSPILKMYKFFRDSLK